jgi:hypothetical protein
MSEAPRIELVSPERTEFLRLEVLTPRWPEAVELELGVECQVRGFAARTTSWAVRPAVAEFARALEALERTRRGRAELWAEDPEDLTLAVAAMDSVGHMVLEFTVSRLSLIGDSARPVTLRLAGGFELDPGALPGLVEQVRKLAR